MHDSMVMAVCILPATSCTDYSVVTFFKELFQVLVCAGRRAAAPVSPPAAVCCSSGTRGAGQVGVRAASRRCPYRQNGTS